MIELALQLRELKAELDSIQDYEEWKELFWKYKELQAKYIELGGCIL